MLQIFYVWYSINAKNVFLNAHNQNCIHREFEIKVVCTEAIVCNFVTFQVCDLNVGSVVVSLKKSNAFLNIAVNELFNPDLLHICIVCWIT